MYRSQRPVSRELILVHATQQDMRRFAGNQTRLCSTPWLRPPHAGSTVSVADRCQPVDDLGVIDLVLLELGKVKCSAWNSLSMPARKSSLADDLVLLIVAGGAEHRSDVRPAAERRAAQQDRRLRHLDDLAS
jgi:hypothetical protein